MRYGSSDTLAAVSQWRSFPVLTLSKQRVDAVPLVTDGGFELGVGNKSPIINKEVVALGNAIGVPQAC